ncbi:MAG: hypothetical protein ACREFX_12615 [Opitutaceae bacterium]
MYRKRTLYLLAALLILEGVIIVAIRSRMPRPARALAGGIDLVGAIAVLLIARQKKE